MPKWVNLHINADRTNFEWNHILVFCRLHVKTNMIQRETTESYWNEKSFRKRIDFSEALTWTRFMCVFLRISYFACLLYDSKINHSTPDWRAAKAMDRFLVSIWNLKAISHDFKAENFQRILRDKKPILLRVGYVIQDHFNLFFIFLTILSREFHYMLCYSIYAKNSNSSMRRWMIHNRIIIIIIVAEDSGAYRVRLFIMRVRTWLNDRRRIWVEIL